ncbi:hypothetical protein KO500_10140 [Cellulophaga baltica]|uniref:hypothetical protein n=1 Tax=Cellulophaga TaxID=104264 RepID=UPI001C0742BA|nr:MULTISPECIES: hypothetical protein [Cellulophaga]MBU2996797.1 hypothetical protein [Cellulophaga baltica]MDO6768193.1 hypothetical protein [Cellulophaga sp. 1_MG-2023]
MKKLFSIFLFVIGSQVLLAHPKTEHHAHDSFTGELAWLILPLIAIGLIAWKFSKSKIKKFKN